MSTTAPSPAQSAAGVDVSTVDTWLGDGAVLATLHLPETAAVGIVVVPPLGYEYTVAYRTLRHLADRIAVAGMAAARFDHAGFGDSTVAVDAGSLDVGPRLAAAALREAGARGIVYLGLGSGALVASRAAAADPEATGLVIWDAPGSGKLWLRRQRSLYQIEVGTQAEPAEDPGTVVVAGAEFAADVVAVVESLAFDPSLTGRMPVMVAIREGAAGTVPKALRGVVDELTVISVPGHEDSLDMSSILATIPGASVAAVVGWLTETFGGASTPAPLTVPEAVTSARVGASAGAGAGSIEARAGSAGAGASSHTDSVEERIVRVGPNSLFGIETVPANTESVADLPAVLLHNGSSEHRTGATRHQVDLARRLAAKGMRVLRVDRRGTGETGAVTPDEPNLLFTQEWLDDGEDAIAWLALPREKMGIVGMCVGGWMALAGSPASTSFIAALALNDYRVHPSAPQVRTEGVDDAESAEPIALKDRLVAVAKKRLPYGAMNALASRGVVQFVEPNLRAALEAGTDVLVFNGPEDTEVFEAHGGRRAVQRLAASKLPATAGRLTVVERASGDHALYSPGIRRAALDAAVEQATRAFGL